MDVLLEIVLLGLIESIDLYISEYFQQKILFKQVGLGDQLGIGPKASVINVVLIGPESNHFAAPSVTG